ncbi:MAG: hypothetical protein PVH87_17200 [Desulfobacteraceae bacterium]|jgi:hypothetical protein
MDNINMQLTEFCHRCQNVQNIKGTAFNREEKTSDGETRSVATVSYHCEACHTFIRSEEIKPKNKRFDKNMEPGYP